MHAACTVNVQVPGLPIASHTQLLGLCTLLLLHSFHRKLTTSTISSQGCSLHQPLTPAWRDACIYLLYQTNKPNKKRTKMYLCTYTCTRECIYIPTRSRYHPSIITSGAIRSSLPARTRSNYSPVPLNELPTANPNKSLPYCYTNSNATVPRYPPSLLSSLPPSLSRPAALFAPSVYTQSDSVSALLRGRLSHAEGFIHLSMAARRKCV